jgi:hypothetical protein
MNIILMLKYPSRKIFLALVLYIYIYGYQNLDLVMPRRNMFLVSMLLTAVDAVVKNKIYEKPGIDVCSFPNIYYFSW